MAGQQLQQPRRGVELRGVHLGVVEHHAHRREVLAPAPADRELAAAARKAEVVRRVLPDLGSRLDSLLDTLRESMPPAQPLGPAHGDFHVDQLLEGYGCRPEGFDWHVAAAILGRAAHPFQRQVPDWPRRVEGTIAAAEEALR